MVHPAHFVDLLLDLKGLEVVKLRLVTLKLCHVSELAGRWPPWWRPLLHARQTLQNRTANLSLAPQNPLSDRYSYAGAHSARSGAAFLRHLCLVSCYSVSWSCSCKNTGVDRGLRLTVCAGMRSKSTTRPPLSPVAKCWPVASNSIAEMMSAAHEAHTAQCLFIMGSRRM